MTLTEIWQKLLLDSGQYLYESALGLDPDNVKFEVFVKSVLAIYSKYIPVEKQFNLNISGSSYDFTGSEYGIPNWVSEVILVSLPLLGISDITNTSPDVNVFFEYRKPILYVSIAGTYDVTALFNHIIEDDNVESIDESDDLFFKLLTAKFLQMIGRSRRAFTLNDLPVTMDAPELISEGKELEQEALEELGEQSKWYLSWS